MCKWLVVSSGWSVASRCHRTQVVRAKANRYWPTKFQHRTGQSLEVAKAYRKRNRTPSNARPAAFSRLTSHRALASRASRSGYDAPCHWLRRCAALTALVPSNPGPCLLCASKQRASATARPTDDHPLNWAHRDRCAAGTRRVRVLLTRSRRARERPRGPVSDARTGPR